MQFYENYYWSSIEVVVAYSVTTVCVNFPDCCCFSYQVRQLNEQLEFSYYKNVAYIAKFFILIAQTLQNAWPQPN